LGAAWAPVRFGGIVVIGFDHERNEATGGENSLYEQGKGSMKKKTTYLKRSMQTIRRSHSIEGFAIDYNTRKGTASVAHADFAEGI
jgi:hypothetical protein